MPAFQCFSWGFARQEQRMLVAVEQSGRLWVTTKRIAPMRDLKLCSSVLSIGSPSSKVGSKSLAIGVVQARWSVAVNFFAIFVIIDSWLMIMPSVSSLRMMSMPSKNWASPPLPGEECHFASYFSRNQFELFSLAEDSRILEDHPHKDIPLGKGGPSLIHHFFLLSGLIHHFLQVKSSLKIPS